MRSFRRQSAAVLALAVGISAPLLHSLPSYAAPSTWISIDGNMRFTPPMGVTFDWANSGAASPVPVCPPGDVNVTGTGGLFNCGAPIVGSSPPGPPFLTPAALADPTRISSTFIVDPGNSDMTACGRGDPTTFTTSTKNGDPISGMTFGTGTVPDKDKLTNIYAASHATLARPEVFFGAERLTNNGDSHIDFEFLQSIVGVTPGCSGGFTGHRTEGDLLLAVDFTGGGAIPTNALYQWHCNAEPGPQPPDGTVCDPAGTAHYQQITIPGSVNFAVNMATIPCGGWICRDTGGVTTQVAPNDFMEGGIDLTLLNFTGCFNTFLPHTRTAQSFTAQLTDFAGPAPFTTCRTPSISTTSSPTGFNLAPGIATSDRVTVQDPAAMSAPQGTVAFFLCSPSQVTAGGCPGGTQVGTVRTLIAGVATSDTTIATTALGTYCWRAVYTPTGSSTGIFAGGVHTDATSECFTVGVPGAPGAGRGMNLPMPPPAFVSGNASSDTAPIRIQIPSIGLNADVESVGILGNGLMDVPRSLADAGWLGTSVAPGSLGNAVITGHLDGSEGQPAAFWSLQRLRSGDSIFVTNALGVELQFVVTKIARYDRVDIPLVTMFGPSRQARLNLITCAGPYVRGDGGYRDRLVVYARLV